MNKYYREEWEYVKRKSSRPVMWVDYLRWKLIYHFGGLYWQYGSKLKTNINDFIPSNNGVLLFTEGKLGYLYRLYTKFYRIRDGKEESSTRVGTQCFSAYPHHKFVKHIINKIVYNLNKYCVNEDYDILFISGNDMLSTEYNKYKNHYHNVVLYDYNRSRNMVDVVGHGSWRTDTYFYSYYQVILLILVIVLLFLFR